MRYCSPRSSNSVTYMSNNNNAFWNFFQCYAAEEPDGTSQTYLKGQSELNNADDAQSTISTASTEPW